MKKHTFLDLALMKNSAASEVITLQFSTAPLPKVNWLLDLLEKVFLACATFRIEMG